MVEFERDVNDIVADNIRRLRGARGWSRRLLAENASAWASTTWSVWRIIDLEGGRTGSPPASARWEDLVALSLAFKVPIWDIVLPDEDEMVLIYSRLNDSSDRIERILLSDREFVSALSGFGSDRFRNDKFRETLRSHTGGAVTREELAERLRVLASQVDALTISHSVDAIAERSDSEDQDPGDSMSD